MHVCTCVCVPVCVCVSYSADVLRVDRLLAAGSQVGVHQACVVCHERVQQHQPEGQQVHHPQSHDLQQGHGAGPHVPHLRVLLDHTHTDTHTQTHHGSPGLSAGHMLSWF